MSKALFTKENEGNEAQKSLRSFSSFVPLVGFCNSFPFFRHLFFTSLLAVLLAGCATKTHMKMDRTKLISMLEHEMVSNTSWLRIHAAEGLLDNGHIGKIPELFRPEADTATAPYRIGVWRVLARSTSGNERNGYVKRIRAVMHDPQAIDRISAAESLGKINAAIREDREMISNWLKTADDATAPFPLWSLVLSAGSSERANDEAALAKLLSSPDPVARLRAAFALGRLKNLSVDSIVKFRDQLKVEPADSIARIYFITALLLHVKDEAEISNLKKELIPYLNTGKSNELLEIGISIGLRGNVRDLQMLEPLLKNPDTDARIGAANGMLQFLK